MRATQKLAVGLVAATPVLVAGPVFGRTAGAEANSAYAEAFARERFMVEALSTDLSTKLELAQDRLPPLILAQAQTCPRAADDVQLRPGRPGAAPMAYSADATMCVQGRGQRETATVVPTASAGGAGCLPTVAAQSAPPAGANNAGTPEAAARAAIRPTYDCTVVATGTCAAVQVATGTCAAVQVATGTCAAVQVATGTCAATTVFTRGCAPSPTPPDCAAAH